ncbi:MAG: MAE_28990/MAE_18760 family HEPN-like nuclease [Coleofasciculus sp. B1-GNL1-01]|uniref:MAE_28990/MAE_18760 family HEPN-like nuclease n=1 Tax=Coleofasciculus sp. B1-GNL1-01 TaxID=3068484 RepID=UPI0032FA3B47
MSNWLKQLEEDLDWRLTELAILKKQAVLASKDSDRYRALLRALWAMLYAHYEGFCKFAWDLYLDELQKAGVKRKNCKDEIAKLSLQKQFKRLKGDLSPESIWNFGQTGFRTMLEDNLDFQVKLETKSNLYPQLFKENSLKVCLSCTLVDQYEIELKGLVRRRNEIAHGQKMIIKDLNEYKKYEDAAIEVMHELAIAIVDCLDQRLYLKNP